jgi:GNAT superfamily N-acetyltransferase
VLEDFSAAAIVDAIEENHIDYWLHYGDGPGGEVHEGRELTWFASGIAHPLVNGVMRARFTPQDAARKAAEIIGEFRRRGIPLEWAIGSSTRPRDLGRYLSELGLHHSHDYPGMAVDLRELPREVVPPKELSIEPANGLRSLEACLKVAVVAFGVPPEAARILLAVERRASRGRAAVVQHFLGRLDGRPVATSMLYATRGVAGIYLVGTLPEVRGRGIARAMTLTALLTGRRLGYRIGALQATELGLPVYRRLGFREFSSFELYSQDDEALRAPATTATL